MLTILYVGSTSPFSTSYQRACALARLGHSLIFFDPYEHVSTVLLYKQTGFIHYRTGYRFIQHMLSNKIREEVRRTGRVNLVWVDSGELLGPTCLNALKQLKCPIVLYNVDDPTGQRDGNRFASLISALPLYDLVVVVRIESERECYTYGATNVLRVYRSYDEIAHKPFDTTAQIDSKFISDVAFVGTWMRHEKRDRFMHILVAEEVPLSIWGDQWQKSPYWTQLQKCYRGKALYGRDYVAAIQGAKICLGLLSKGNRDLHTTRSLEIPFAAGLLCAERTTEHQELYKEGVEALFWSDAEECAQVCLQWLQKHQEREAIRLAGMRRIRELKLGNEDVCKIILDKVFS